MPDAIQNAPELLPGLRIYYEAFFELETERTYGQVTSPIPWSSIIKYAEIHGFDDEMTDELVYFIRALDNEFLQRLAKKQQNAANAPRPRKKFGR